MTEERRQRIQDLHMGIIEEAEDIESLLWDTILSYQGFEFHTLSGLCFFYNVKHRKNGMYSGELLISRKEASKTLTRSSIMLAFRRVAEQIQIAQINGEKYIIPPAYKGPKAIGQIFGISYIYSFFLEFGLIREEERTGKKL